MTNNCWAMANR